jgi:hypothetical protein
MARDRREIRRSRRRWQAQRRGGRGAAKGDRQLDLEQVEEGGEDAGGRGSRCRPGGSRGREARPGRAGGAGSGESTGAREPCPSPRAGSDFPVAGVTGWSELAPPGPRRTGGIGIRRLVGCRNRWLEPGSALRRQRWDGAGRSRADRGALAQPESPRPRCCPTPHARAPPPRDCSAQRCPHPFARGVLPPAPACSAPLPSAARPQADFSACLEDPRWRLDTVVALPRAGWDGEGERRKRGFEFIVVSPVRLRVALDRPFSMERTSVNPPRFSR